MARTETATPAVRLIVRDAPAVEAVIAARAARDAEVSAEASELAAVLAAVVDSASDAALLRGGDRWVIDLVSSIIRERFPRTTKRRIAAGSHASLKVFRRDGWACVACGEVGGDLTVDHIVPVSRGGTNDHSNLQTLCRSCNARKGAS